MEMYQWMKSQHEPNLTMDFVDHTKYYDRVIERQSGSYMPNGPGVRKSILRIQTADVFNHNFWYSVEYEYRPWFPKFLKHLPTLQKVHRSRVNSIAYKPLLYNEWHNKIANVKLHAHELGKLKIPEPISHSAFVAMMQITRKHMTGTPEYAKKYRDDHKGKGVGGGRKWDEMEFTNKEWYEIRSMQRDEMQYMEEHAGWYDPEPYNIGIRNRADKVEKLQRAYTIQKKRDRVVGFKARRSTPGMWIPNKKLWYGEFYEYLESKFSLSYEAHYPDLLGGETYAVASELFNDHSNFYAMDGNKYDAVVGYIAGNPFNPVMTTFDGLTCEASGCLWTNMMNQMTTMWLTKDVRGVAMPKSDDFNSWDAKNLPSTYAMEYQPEDTKIGFILGAAYGWDHFAPRTVGVKLTVDNADKMKSITKAQFNGEPIVEEGTQTKEEQMIWTGLQVGRYGDLTLPEAARKLPYTAWKTGNIVEMLVDNLPVKDPSFWAREYQIRF